MKCYHHLALMAMHLGGMSITLLLTSCLTDGQVDNQHFYVRLNKGASTLKTEEFSKEVDSFASRHGFARQPGFSESERLHVANIIVLNYTLGPDSAGKVITLSANCKPTDQRVFVSIEGPGERQYQDTVDKLFNDFRQQLDAKYGDTAIFGHMGRVPSNR